MPPILRIVGLFFLTGALSLVCSRISSAQDSSTIAAGEGSPQSTTEQLNFFESKIRPVLVRECYSCHSNQVGQVRGGLWLDTASALRTGGDSGPGVVPGDLQASLLWNAINHEDWNMPPGRKLSKDILNDFQQWIEMGAPDPRQEESLTIRSTISDADVEAGRQFWSFQRPKPARVPSVAADWPLTDIDRFVYDKLNSNGLQPSPDVQPSTLLRRLCFDLIGLPPTPEQSAAFSKQWQDDQQAAITDMVDQLLAEPQFGERWGRHWLDVARYAESSGRELNITFPYSWRYRDYVIDSFNNDKPYDRFVQEQIAGDLLPAKSDQQWAEQLIATGFLTLGAKELTEQNPRQFEWDLVDEQIDVTTRVMLGVSVACARCHDHKFEPIPQTDYYALAGIFRSMSTHYGTFRTQQNRRSSNLIELPTSDPDPFRPAISKSKLAELKQELEQKQDELQQARLARRQRQQRNSSERPVSVNSVLQVAQLSNAAGLLQATIDSYDASGQPMTLCMAVQETRPVETRVLQRGEFNQLGQTVTPGAPRVLCEQPLSISSSSSGRLELARWIGSEDNPLTARVMVNRVWQHLMGQGIVRTPEDFGSTGLPPTHPELLDHLATTFVKSGWSIKQLIRSIVVSRIYRTGSQMNDSSFQIDPENRYLWRMEPKRLEAEAIRDAMLAISGQIDLRRPKGSIVSQAGPAVVRDGRIFSASLSRPATSGDSVRDRLRAQAAKNFLGSDVLQPNLVSLDQAVRYRSVYLPIVRDHVPRSLEVLDFAESSIVVGQREVSNTADQGLYFMNNEFVIEQADKMAGRLMAHSSQLRDQLKYAFELTYARLPSSRELQLAMDFHRSLRPSPTSNSPATNSVIADRRRLTGDRASLSSARAKSSGRVESSSPTAQLEHQKLAVICQALMAVAEFRFLN